MRLLGHVYGKLGCVNPSSFRLLLVPFSKPSWPHPYLCLDGTTFLLLFITALDGDDDDDDDDAQFGD